MNKTILIVEDESLVARDIRGMLRSLGYEQADICSTGADAVRLAAEKKPDLILMDIVLKGPMDGISAAAKIRESQNLPVIYLTAYTDEATLERAKRTDPQGYLLKPFELGELQAAIGLAFHKHGEEIRQRADQRRLTAILDFLGDAVVAADTKDLVTFMNPQAEKLTGWKSGEAYGRPVSSIVRLVAAKTGKPMPLRAGKILRSGAWEEPIHCGLVSASGTEFPVDVHATFVAEDTGALTHVAFVFKEASPAGPEERKLAYSAIHDPLTGLPNRVLFEDRLDLAIAQAARKRESLAVILLGFKRHKDLIEPLGREAGDKAFREAVDRISKVVRESDTAARFGEDEIALLLPDCPDAGLIADVIRRSREAVTDGTAGYGPPSPTSVAIGRAVYPEDGDSGRKLVEHAESALAADRETSAPPDPESPPPRPTKRRKSG
jgi:diguanylate cyclase (GGDEF)-like protein/PAS domain S-box-containing protein